MLLLTREINESVRISETIDIKVISIVGNKVILGFNVPKEIPVHREEIYQKIKNHKENLIREKKDEKNAN